VNSPWGGCVESLVTFATQRFFFPDGTRPSIKPGPMAEDPCRSANDEPDKSACLCVGLSPTYVTLCPGGAHRTALSVMLKVLHCPLMRLCRASRGERPKIPPFSGLGIFFS
jgi:hypothetical protein